MRYVILWNSGEWVNSSEPSRIDDTAIKLVNIKQALKNL